ncbi:MAG: hypothetical protein IKH12_08490 [Clostridia bacterium]|nr:hypothetical protein [Clostridia bacterium]
MRSKTTLWKQTLALVLSLLMLLAVCPAVSFSAFAETGTADEADLAAAAQAEALIDAIGTVSLTPESKATIDAARAAFDSLNGTQRRLVNNLDKLILAEDTYAVLEAAEQKERDDRNAAAAVDQLISQIGTVTYTGASRTKILRARTAYDQLTNTQKSLVTRYGELTTAEATYARLKAEDEQRQAAVPDICPWCGTEHANDFSGLCVRFYHGMLYFFAHLLGRK